MSGPEPGASPRLYRYLVVVPGLAVVVYAGYRLAVGAGSYLWLIPAALTIPAGALVLRLPGVKAKLSISDAVICTNLILFGPSAGVITAALDALFGSLRCKTASRRAEFLLFNVACMGLSAAAAGEVFFSIVGRRMEYPHATGSGGIFLLGLLALALAYFLANSFLVAGMVALDQGQNVFQIWNRCFLWAIVNYVAASVVAGAVALTTGQITAVSMFVIAAVLLSVFLSAKSYAASLARSSGQN